MWIGKERSQFGIIFLSIPSLSGKGIDEVTHQVDGRFLVPPRPAIMLAEERVCGGDDHHVKQMNRRFPLGA